jgi:hypothetical protein
MRYASFIGSILLALAIATTASYTPLLAQGSTIGTEQLTVFAKAHTAIAAARDAVQAELAQTKNKTPEAQKQLQEKLHEQITHVLHENQLTQQEFDRLLYAISSNEELRKSFDEVVTKLTGVPTGSQQAAREAAPAGGQGGRRGGGGGAGAENDPVRQHMAHVTTSFNDTPNMQGLLPTALAEARIAAEHAGLAAKSSADLAAMKLHAGHVIHAVDPGQVPMGPGQGYGLKKAAAGVVAHVELAAKSPGAAQGVATHATHVITSARNTEQRANDLVALAKQIQAAATVEEAAALAAKLNTLAQQLLAGADTNGDGRIGWQEGEGGLQHVEQHVNLLLGG